MGMKTAESTNENKCLSFTEDAFGISFLSESERETKK